MMSKHSYALTLADLLDGPISSPVNKQAAAELRRLHEANQMLVEALELAITRLGDTASLYPNLNSDSTIKELCKALAKAKEQA